MTSPKPDDLQPAPDCPDQITFFASAGLTDEDRAKIVALVTNGEHLAAIKWVRECFNLALADGKAVVEKVVGFKLGTRLPDPDHFVKPDAPAQPKPLDYRPDWLPADWTARLGRYDGPNGERVYTHGDGHATAHGSRHTEIEAVTDWIEDDKRALVMALANPGTRDVLLRVRRLAESFVLPDDVIDASPKWVGAHEVAKRVLAILDGAATQTS